MKCIYITSVFPCISETFIHREMQQLSFLGWDIEIFRIRGKESSRKNKQMFSGSYLSPIMINPVYWIRGLIWTLRHRKTEFIKMLAQVWKANATVATKIKLFVLLFTVLGIAEFVESHRLVFTHIRAHFLHNEAVSAYWLSLLVRVPFSLTVHTRMIYYPFPLVENVIRNASFCVGISNETVSLLCQFRGTSDGIFLIRNGVDINSLRSNERITPPLPVILAVGRLVPKKGFDVLINACSVLNQRKINFVCRIIGSGPEYGFLAKLISANNLSQQVFLTGAMEFEDIVCQYQEATVLVMPSRICNDDVDGLPTVIIEALAMGVPVIASAVAGIPDLIKDKITGLLVQSNDENALAKAIANLLCDKKMRDNLATQGQNEVLDNFDISRTIEQLNELMMLNLVNQN